MQPLHSVQTEQRQFMQNLTRVRTNVRNAKNVKKSVRRVLKSVTQLPKLQKYLRNNYKGCLINFRQPFLVWNLLCDIDLYDGNVV